MFGFDRRPFVIASRKNRLFYRLSRGARRLFTRKA